MAIERTFSIIKPDAVERNKIGEITAMLESAGLSWRAGPLVRPPIAASGLEALHC